MNIDGLVVATLIFACVFLLLSILMIEIHGLTGFFIELQASLSGLGKIGLLMQMIIPIWIRLCIHIKMCIHTIIYTIKNLKRGQMNNG